MIGSCTATKRLAMMASNTTQTTRMLWIIFFLIILTLQIETYERVYFRHRIFVRRHLSRSASRHTCALQRHRQPEGSLAIRWCSPRTRLACPPAKYHPRHRHGLKGCKYKQKSIKCNRFYTWTWTFRFTSCRNLILKGFCADFEHPHGERHHGRRFR